MSVWKDARALGEAAGRVAVELGKGVSPSEIEGASRYAGGPRGRAVDAILLRPVPITQKDLARRFNVSQVTAPAASPHLLRSCA